jgi:DNA modification methylase
MADLNATLFGVDLFGDAIKPDARGILREKFLVPPFSILSSRDGDWQERKKRWQGLGIQSEIGRDAKAYNCHDWIEGKRDEGFAGAIHGEGTSIFDPALTELCYSWFCPPGGQIVDPFAGGSVRGIVASVLGFKYWGCDLRTEQVEANQKQGSEILGGALPTWISGDSLETVPASAPEADFIFSCPPYGDLEKYSDDPRDLSNMEYHTFLAQYKRIIMRVCAKLKPNRFACFVVGDFRDKRGFLRNFVADTTAAFKEQRLEFYNEIILVTSVGSAAMRATKQFEASRKVVRTHQTILVFVKGDPRIATEALSE